MYRSDFNAISHGTVRWFYTTNKLGIYDLDLWPSELKLTAANRVYTPLVQRLIVLRTRACEQSVSGEKAASRSIRSNLFL